MSGDVLFPAREAYDRAAREYDRWQWQDVWRKVEAPRVLSEISRGPVGRILDLGTGTGFYAAVLAGVGLPVVGLDVSEKMLMQAREASGGRIPLVLGDACQLPFAARMFSQVLATRVLSQVGDIDSVFREVARVLKPGGAFVMSEIDPGHRYRHTELPLHGGKIGVETFKRSRTELIQRARRAGGFYVSSQNWIRTTDLNAGEGSYQLASLDLSQDSPLAFVLRLVRG